VGLFLAQLEERAWPQFPESQWWAALRFADREADYVRAPTRPQITAKQAQLKGEPPKNFDWRNQALVRAAWNRWWRKYGRL
jgi:hypothetical protein